MSKQRDTEMNRKVVFTPIKSIFRAFLTAFMRRFYWVVKEPKDKYLQQIYF